MVSNDQYIIGSDDLILVTGATGFIGSRLVETLLELGFRNLRCFARPSKKQERLADVVKAHRSAFIEVLRAISYRAKIVRMQPRMPGSSFIWRQVQVKNPSPMRS